MPRRIPPDVARVIDTYEKLGRGARRGLYVAKKQARAELTEAALRAEALRRRLRRHG